MPITTKIKTKYDYDLQASLAPGINFVLPKDKSFTNQADLETSDINKIMARYEKTGVLLDGTGILRQPNFGDFSELKDYHTMLSVVRNAERVFATLPANVRIRFKNDPQELIDFLKDDKNTAEAVKLGLKEAPIIPDPDANLTAEQRAEKARLAALRPPTPPPPAG